MKKNANMAILITRYYFLFFGPLTVFVPLVLSMRDAVPCVLKNTKSCYPKHKKLLWGETKRKRVRE